MADVLEIAVPWALRMSLLFAIVLYDEPRLGAAALARAWPPASRASAIVCFDVLSAPVHFGRTRRSALGVIVGVFVAAGVYALSVAAGLAARAMVS